MLKFTNMEVVGFIPLFLSEDDPRPAREQINEAYSHGGGWHPFKGFILSKNKYGEYAIKYPGDPLIRELSRSRLRSELLLYFEHSWFAIVQPDGSWELARLD